MTKIPVDSIKIPATFQPLCPVWHGGITCRLYAITSKGGLTIGAHRPRGCDCDDCDDCDEKWYLNIWRELSADIDCAIWMVENDYPDDTDIHGLRAFSAWVGWQVARLEESYGLSDWGYDD